MRYSTFDSPLPSSFVKIKNRQLGNISSFIDSTHKAEADDVTMTAAMNIQTFDLFVASPSRDVKRSASNVLREFGRMRRLTSGICGIEQMYVQLLGTSVAGIRWRNLFGANYRRAERQAVSCRALIGTNITAWVPALDVLHDLLLDSLFKLRPALGTHTLGSFGTLYKSPLLGTDFPHTRKMIKAIHDKRLESEHVHAIVKGTKKPTGRINFSYVKTARQLIRPSLLELKAKLAL